MFIKFCMQVEDTYYVWVPQKLNLKAKSRSPDILIYVVVF